MKVQTSISIDSTTDTASLGYSAVAITLTSVGNSWRHNLCVRSSVIVTFSVENDVMMGHLTYIVFPFYGVKACKRVNHV